MSDLFSALFDWYMANLNYWTIALLMAIESTFVPLPSEVVVPFAAYKAANGELNFALVLLSSTIGALVGSMFNYLLSKHLGRPIVYKLADSKLARLFLVNSHKVEEAEKYFLKNGKTSTFIGRLLPGIRHLISIPAGIAKMELKSFVLYTTLGAFLWNLILGLVGYYAYEVKDQIIHYIGYILILGVLVIIAYLVYKAKFKK